MLRTLALAAALTAGASAIASNYAMADRYCGPDFYYSRHTGECRPYRPYSYYQTPAGVVGGAVGGAGYVAGSAVNAAGNVAGAAVGTAGAVVNSVLPH
jgi:hypothetical protein